jgi:pimeloyl-ACP methyl ester carboxylesterase
VTENEKLPLRIRVHGDPSLPTLVYLPGLHGDWTLVSSFRAAIAGRFRFVEFCYPHKPDLTLDELAGLIESALAENEIRGGWLIGESFGSQPAWQIIDRKNRRAVDSHDTGFCPDGLILAGGFVRHPIRWGVNLLQGVSARLPLSSIRAAFRVYAAYARFRHRQAPETMDSIGEFVASRCQESDRQAITHRYGLINERDLRPIAASFTLPVYYLAGLVDPLVPWPYERWWLRRHCPGYRSGQTIWHADHNVLGTAPRLAADQITRWIEEAESR